MYKCDWCQREFKDYNDFNGGDFFYDAGFELLFSHGCPAPHFPWRYLKIELCNKCRERLLEKMKGMGIKPREIKTDGTEHHFTLKKEGDEWIKIS